MTNNSRWEMSLHEAGHGVVACVLNGRCDGLLLLEGAGLAFIDQLSSDRDAIAIAAGPTAGRLTNEFEPPCCEVISCTDIAKINLQEETALACWAKVSPVKNITRKIITDDRLLALWSIAGRENQPDSWAERVEYAYSVAQELVDKNKQTIVRVARALFERGVLTGAEFKQLRGEQ